MPTTSVGIIAKQMTKPSRKKATKGKAMHSAPALNRKVLSHAIESPSSQWPMTKKPQAKMCRRRSALSSISV
ncbi:hypothetical protein M419DRAFT_124370 [Trichoderma reesei RUT C-30]|uniref:Uncharacterized protein n=1 Tax=Hypocrea jecorina (strain ATCC 56765 / BCRC 32924 / NRRL 11460 / Rut C-30) TaxID=1344414 RepID=A0A024S2F0_HYPJR|nr:hypothetical protein M419DRAFT_124370 [Trichoderma reesei RUT C-30]